MITTLKNSSADYSQNYAASTFLVGMHRAVGISRGILVVVLDNGRSAGWKEPALEYVDDFDEDLIETKHIKLAYFNDIVTVDCLLLSKEVDIKQIEVLAESLGYRSVVVYNAVDVEIVD